MTTPLAPAPYDGPTVLVTLTGRDRPGVTAALFSGCAEHAVDVLDIEQVVIRGRLVLGVLLTAPRDGARLRSTLASVADGLGVDIEVEPGTGDAARRPGGRVRVTLLGAPLRPGAVAAVAGRVADTGANIDRIVRMARYPVTAVDLDVSGADPQRLRMLLAQESVRQRVDIAVQAASIHRHAQRLVVMDVDSTLVQGEVIEMLAEHAGCRDEVARVTEQAMAGEMDFSASLQARVALLQGVPAGVLDEVYADLVLTPGARTLIRTLRRLGYRFALVSGGFTHVIDPLAADLGVDYSAANTLEIVDGRLTGRLVGPVLDRAGKAAALRRFATEAGIPMANTIAIGDGANDLDMLTEAGLGVAFNAKPVVRQAADAALSVPYLDAIAYLLGVTREEIEAADAEQ
ncbi:MAG: phosphoserine phosphatase [Nocardioidaceae bacterium]|jgi:phosphoserine phosphatase|nr:phosphoserine phosphatase [Nocardioidaceae bacterium]